MNFRGIYFLQDPSSIQCVVADRLGSVQGASPKPLLSCSRPPLTLTLQLVTHQLKTDAALIDMVGQMRNACKFTTAANKLDDQSQLLKPIVKDLLAEIADCARFVQDYAKHGFTGVCSRHCLSAKTDLCCSSNGRYRQPSKDQGVLREIYQAEKRLGLRDWIEHE